MSSENYREKAFAGLSLLPCPHCGFKPDIMDYDCIYPAGRARNPDGTYLLWNLNCYETGGGCGATVYGPSAIECIRHWNASAPEPAPNPPAAPSEFLPCPFCSAVPQPKHLQTHGNFCTLFCPKCKAEALGSSPEECKMLWNARSPRRKESKKPPGA